MNEITKDYWYEISSLAATLAWVSSVRDDTLAEYIVSRVSFLIHVPSRSNFVVWSMDFREHKLQHRRLHKAVSEYFWNTRLYKFCSSGRLVAPYYFLIGGSTFLPSKNLHKPRLTARFWIVLFHEISVRRPKFCTGASILLSLPVTRELIRRTRRSRRSTQLV